jgi:hypothetical protein
VALHPVTGGNPRVGRVAVLARRPIHSIPSTL